jgi:Outer membrane protein beta-barrel domain
MRRALFAVLLLAALVPVASAQNHVELGVYGDYFRLSQTNTNMAGLGGRLGFTVTSPLSFEAEMSYDFEQAFTEGFTNSGTGTITTATSNVQLLYGLFGPKIESHGPVRVFLTVKGGFIHFNLGKVPGTFASFTSSVENLRENNVSGTLYPGGGLETSIGPIGLRLDVGDDIYFNSGAHHNLRLAFGPVIRF